MMLNDLPPLPPIRKSSAKNYVVERQEDFLPGQLESSDQPQIRPKTTERRTNIGAVRKSSDDSFSNSSSDARKSKKKSGLCCCGGKTGAESEDEEVGADSFLQENLGDHDNEADDEGDSMSSHVKIS